MISVTHRASGRTKEFGHPRDAQQFVELLSTKNIKWEDLDIINDYGVSLSAYQSRIPRTAQELIEKIELAHGGNLVPRWHWIPKKQTYSRGLTSYTPAPYKVTHITVSAGSNPYDIIDVVLHEMAHAIVGHEWGHGKKFYLKLFELFRTYLPGKVEKECVLAEFRYKKSSKYWYAELYNLEEILAQYRPKDQTENILKDMFLVEGVAS